MSKKIVISYCADGCDAPITCHGTYEVAGGVDEIVVLDFNSDTREADLEGVQVDVFNVGALPGISADKRNKEVLSILKDLFNKKNEERLDKLRLRSSL